MQRTSIRGHAVRRVDGVNGLYVYAVAYGGGSDGAPHDALSTQLWPSARIAAGLVAEHLCTIRKDDDDEHPGGPDTGIGAGGV